MFFWFFSIFSCSTIIPVHSHCLEDQNSLLLQLKNNLNFDSSFSVKLVSWTQINDCCEWEGVTCDQPGHVIGLDLSGELIVGGFNESSSLFGLQFLETLNLAYNNFDFTQIPSNFGNLARLKYLNLSYGEFGGQIPIGLSHLTRLVTLDLSNYNLKLENPNVFTLIHNLSKLTELHLDGVDISANGYEWGHAISSSLPNLQILSLESCYLSGPIDSSLQNLQFLSKIDLSRNNLSAPVPDYFANFTNLKLLSLSFCNLYGTFPENIFQRATLEALDLSSNPLLNGSLPDFPQNGSLQNLVLTDTSFSGNLPDSVGNLEKLRWIDISRCHFGGEIPNSFENLSHLEILDFSFNNFTGPIPSFQGSKNLTNIHLTGNALTGRIPCSLFSLPSLIHIDLSNNQFSEVSGFPPDGSISPLESLDLNSNKLEGPIPSCFFDFQSLQTLDLSVNSFNGTIQLESTFQRLQNLTNLDLSHNNLSVDGSGDISSLSSFPQLYGLKLASCNLEKFPALLMNQSRIYYLDLSDNQISGVIPNWIWNVGNGGVGNLNLSCNLLVGLQNKYIMPRDISILDLHSNQLGGEIPIPPLHAVYVDYSNNMLTGAIHPSICNASYLEFLDLSYNRFSGTIPQCMIDTLSTTLSILNLQNNNLAGNITGTFPEGCNLRTLDLNGNHLEGQVPKSLANCVNVEVLNLGTNSITDNFPCFLANLSSLHILVLRSNKFRGNINCHGIQCNIWPKLQIIDLASNNFSGILPPKFFLKLKAMIDWGNPQADGLGYITSNSSMYYQDSVTFINKGQEMKLVKILTIYTIIDFSNNSFKGDIPDTIGDLKSLYALNLSHNALTGTIPSSLGNLKQLGSLDLSWNKLNGSIPPTLASLSFLSFLNLSYNQLVGMIPTGSQFQTFPSSSFEGNKGLWGYPLTPIHREPTPTPAGPSTPTFEERDSYFDEDEIKWIYITAAIGFTMGFGVVVAPLLYWKRWRQCYYKHVERILLKIFSHHNARPTHQRRR